MQRCKAWARFGGQFGRIRGGGEKEATSEARKNDGGWQEMGATEARLHVEM